MKLFRCFDLKEETYTQSMTAPVLAAFLQEENVEAGVELSMRILAILDLLDINEQWTYGPEDAFVTVLRTA